MRDPAYRRPLPPTDQKSVDEELGVANPNREAHTELSRRHAASKLCTLTKTFDGFDRVTKVITKRIRLLQCKLLEAL